MDTTEKIYSAPEYANRYPYIVARREGGRWWFWGAWQSETLAQEAAISIGGSVFYNRAAA